MVKSADALAMGQPEGSIFWPAGRAPCLMPELCAKAKQLEAFTYGECLAGHSLQVSKVQKAKSEKRRRRAGFSDRRLDEFEDGLQQAPQAHLQG